jgi:CHASE2 domain-containing sensor protein
MSEPLATQPLLPRISMRWYFILVVLVAGFLTWLTRSEYQQSLVVVVVLLALATMCFLTMSAVCFLLAYSIGAMEKLSRKPEDQLQSPFAHEAMPPQIIPPDTRGS